MKRKEINDEDEDDDDSVVIQADQDLLHYSSESENQFEKRDHKTGLIVNGKTAQRFIDNEAIHESDSDCSTSEDEQDSTGLDGFIDNDEDDEDKEQEDFEDESSSNSDEYGYNESSSDEASEDSYESLKKRTKKPDMDDLRAIREGQEIVKNGYAFPQDAKLSEWYHRV